MLKTYGLHSYVLNNNLKSLGLLAGFLLVVQLMFAAVWAFTGLFVRKFDGFSSYLTYVLSTTWDHAPSVIAGSLVWSVLAFLYYKSLVRGMTGLHEVSREQEPRLYNIVENLAIATGLTTPRIEISESSALNAFAMGLTPAHSTIGVTRGLLRVLNDQELEAVVAHELTHIRTLDVRLMTFATIFCGIIFSIGWFLSYRARELFRQAKGTPLVLVPIVIWVLAMQAMSPSVTLWQVLGLTSVLIVSALLVSLCLRFAISRNREYVADLGACELTKNPEALISALVKIHGRNLMPHCDSTVQAMMIAAPSEGMFASHPDLESRIDAIVTFAATHLNGLRLAPASQRRIPSVNTEETHTAFSITAMRYPAWISKPLIVLPAIATGLFIGHLNSTGINIALDQYMGLPNLVAEVIEAPVTAGSESMNLRGAGQQGGSVIDFIKNMSLGEWKALLFYVFLSAAVVFGARFLRTMGIETNLIRQLSGAPSKEMESDWEETTPPDLARMNAASTKDAVKMARMNSAIENAVAAQRQNLQPTANHAPLQTGRAVFGKRQPSN